VLAADHAVDYVVGFLAAYSMQFAQDGEQRLETIKLMQSYIKAIGGLIEHIERMGYQSMTNPLAVKAIQARVAALKIDLSGLSVLAKTVPGLRFDNVHTYVEQGEIHAKENKEQMGWWSSLWQGAKDIKSFASKWTPRLVTQKELLAIRQQTGVREQRVMEQHGVLNKLEPDIEPQSPSFAPVGISLLHPQPFPQQQQQFPQGFPLQNGPFDNGQHFNPTYQQPQFQQQVFDQPPQGFGQQPYYAHPPQGFVFGQPQQGFGQQQQPQQGFVFGQPQQGFGQPPQGDGTNTQK